MYFNHNRMSSTKICCVPKMQNLSMLKHTEHVALVFKYLKMNFIYDPHGKFTSEVCSPVSILTVEPTSILTR